jgi:hypothetical protein
MYGGSTTVATRAPSRKNRTEATPVSSAAVAVAVIDVPAVAVAGAARVTVGGAVSGSWTIDVSAVLTARLSDVSMAWAENVTAEPIGVAAGTTYGAS